MCVHSFFKSPVLKIFSLGIKILLTCSSVALAQSSVYSKEGENFDCLDNYNFLKNYQLNLKYKESTQRVECEVSLILTKDTRYKICIYGGDRKLKETALELFNKVRTKLKVRMSRKEDHIEIFVNPKFTSIYYIKMSSMVNEESLVNLIVGFKR